MKNENGVTIIALVVTITIMAIIGLTVFYTAKWLDQGIDNEVLVAELKTVHHIVLQEHNKKLTLGKDYNYKGVAVTKENFDIYSDEFGIEFQERYGKYYELTPDILKSIGAENVSSDYLVCYETGEVANITKYKTDTGDILYTK